MPRFSLTLSVLGFLLLLIMQGNSIQAIDSADDSAVAVVDVVCDSDNGSDDSVLPPKRISLIHQGVSAAVAFSLPAPVLGLPVSSSLIRAPPVMSA